MEGREQEQRVTVPAVCAVDGCTAKRKYRPFQDWERGGMRNGLLAHPGATVSNGTSCGLRTVFESQLILVSLEISIQVTSLG